MKLSKKLALNFLHITLKNPHVSCSLDVPGPDWYSFNMNFFLPTCRIGGVPSHRFLMRASIAVIVCVSVVAASAAELILAENGQSAYNIVLADNASPSTKHGAKELQVFLLQITGATIPIISDTQPQGPHEIVLGDNLHLRKLGTSIDFASLGQEGYVIRVVGKSLVIAGGALRGNMYGVYGFLEDHLGCHWFAPGVSRIPKQAKLVIDLIDDRQVPVLEYREPYVADCLDGDWCARNRMNSSAGRLETKHGGKVTIWSIAHSWQHLMPVEKYFDAHPEYYSLVNGKRQKKYPQLCCTNPDVIRICSEELCKLIREQPNYTVYGVSQNDWNNHCECKNCQLLAEREGSQIAPGLQLVNRVAEAVEKEFPDKIVQTLAYSWSRKPPKYMRPNPNVVVMLCSIECCFSHPLNTCNSVMNQAFCKDLEGWSKVAPRLWIWDYTTDFAHFLMPFPNQRVLSPNMRFFVAHNVKGVFEQNNTDSLHGELASLGGYVMAKLLWNPNYDANLAMNEFLDAFYGKAATPIRAYIDLLHDHVERENIHVNIWATPDQSVSFWQEPAAWAAFYKTDDAIPDGSHLNDELLTQASQLWQQAEDLMTGQPQFLERVQVSRMSVDYAILERARLQARNKFPKNDVFVQLVTQRFDPFFKTFRSSSIAYLKERHAVDKEAYRQDVAKDLGLKLP
jgi:hypothetical protein